MGGPTMALLLIVKSTNYWYWYYQYQPMNVVKIDVIAIFMQCNYYQQSRFFFFKLMWLAFLKHPTCWPNKFNLCVLLYYIKWGMQPTCQLVLLFLSFVRNAQFFWYPHVSRFHKNVLTLRAASKNISFSEDDCVIWKSTLCSAFVILTFTLTEYEYLSALWGVPSRKKTISVHFS